MLFGDKVNKIAEEKGLTQKDLVIRSGMSQPRISMITRNKVTDPRLQTIKLMAKALDVSVSDLVDDVDAIENFSEDAPHVEYSVVKLDGTPKE